MRNTQNPLDSDPVPFRYGDVVLVTDQGEGDTVSWGKFQVITFGTRYMRLRGVSDDTPMGPRPIRDECPDEVCIQCGRSNRR